MKPKPALTGEQFEVVWRCLDRALYGRTMMGQRRGAKPDAAADTSHLHRDLLRPVLPASSYLKPLPKLRQLKASFFGARQMSTSAACQAVTLPASLAQVRNSFTKAKAGDWVELRSPGGMHHNGLLLDVVDNVVVLLNTKGELSVRGASGVAFVAADIVSVDLIKKVWDEESVVILRAMLASPDRFEDRQMQTSVWYGRPGVRESLREISKLSRDFERNLETAPALVTRMALADIYQRYCNIDHKRSIEFSCFQAAQYLISRESAGVHKDLTVLAYHALRHMIDDPLHFIVSSDFQKWGIFRLRPQKHIYDFQEVSRWVEQRAPQYLDFVDRARKAAASAKSGQTTEGATPFAQDSDRLIVAVLKRSIQDVRAVQPSLYMNMLQSMAADIFGEASDLAETVGAGPLLRKIGVYQPWQNLVAEDVQFKEDFEEVNVSALRAPKGLEFLDKNPLRRTKTYGGDIMQNVRTDWSHLPVYVIDDATAQERDDGVSIERAEDQDGKKTWWVRAHIADPATFFHPLHQASLLAFRRFQTVYFPEKSYKMFNENTLETWPLSLGHQPREGEPQPVLTFSGRIDEDGNTVATHVEGGWIGPPHILTYDQVNTAFGTPAPRPRYWIRNFDLDPIATTGMPPVPVTPEMQADLQTLRMLTDKLQRKRDTLRWEMPSASISVSATGPSTPPRVALGLPGLAATNAVADSILDTGVAQVMVAEVAIMANRIAAQFTFERDIMVPYLVQPPPSGDRATLQRLMAKRDELGMVSYRDVLPNIHKMAIAPSSHSMAPGPHYGLGISDEHGYVRATSPLRRYSDLYIHWQIKEALKSRRWRFNKRVDAATAELVTEIGRDVHKTNLGRRAEHHWLFYGLQQEYNKVRAGQASLESEELFGSLKGIVLQSMAVEQHGVNAGLLFIPALGCRAHFRMPSFTALWQPGQDVKVAIQSFILSDIPRLNVEVTGPA